MSSEAVSTVDTIRASTRSQSSLVDRIVSILIDGNEEQRLDLLRHIQQSASLDRGDLSARLRREIRDRFGPRDEDRFASAIRDPKKFSSIRSWMLSSLVWTDAEQPENRALILEHVHAESEPDRNVRFWTLAGLYERDASWLKDAVDSGLSDPAQEVVTLARAIVSPDDITFVNELRSKLFAEQFELVWPVLRVLRIVPIPELTDDICAQLDRLATGSPLAYDAFYALTHPAMAREAAKRLAKDPGVAGVVSRVIAEARGSNLNAARNFSVLLAAFDDVAIDRALTEAERTPDTRDAAGVLREALSKHRRGADETRKLFIPGYSSDTIDVTNDRLDIQEDVRTLTAVILAKDVTPPLAIGLFGDWGSGKSFFMKSMRVAAEEISNRARGAADSKFCSEIVSIDFNAWHYADTNLWASLVTHMLEQLALHVSPQPTAEQQQAALLAELGSAKAVVGEVEGERQRAQESIEARQEELQRLQRERQEKETRLADLRASDLHSLLAGHSQLKRDLEQSLDRIGVPAVLNSVSDLSSIVSEAYTVRGRLTALLLAVLNGRNRGLVVGLLVVILVVIPSIAWLVHAYIVSSEILVWMSAVTSQLVAVVAAATAVLRKAITHVKSNLKTVEGARQQVDALIAQKRREQTAEEKGLQEQIATLTAKEQAARARLTAASARVVELEERIRSLKEGRSLARFLAERTRSEDYRRHLGLISIIRQDFESLGARLASARADASDGFKRVDRIILYIDDLDRCPENKVMDVLQAIHLLLAFPFFVVVVGVDPRWLLRSLEATYAMLRSNSGAEADDRPDLWLTTPQNYLEKIFQIPFNLRPMTATGYKKLIGGLLASASEPPLGEDVGTEERQHVPLSGPRPSHAGPVESLAGGALGSESSHTAVREERHQRFEPPPSPTPEPDFRIHEDSLVIKEWETKFAERLFALMPTPRAVKRFTNIYRILKAPVPQARLFQFEGTAEISGDFRVPMLLLAMLVGVPRDAVELFPKIQQHVASGRDPVEALQKMSILGLDSRPFRALEEKIRPVVTDTGFPDAPAVYLEWLPRVSRFSFDVGRAVQAGSVAGAVGAMVDGPRVNS